MELPPALSVVEERLVVVEQGCMATLDQQLFGVASELKDLFGCVGARKDLIGAARRRTLLREEALRIRALEVGIHTCSHRTQVVVAALKLVSVFTQSSTKMTIMRAVGAQDGSAKEAEIRV